MSRWKPPATKSCILIYMKLYRNTYLLNVHSFKRDAFCFITHTPFYMNGEVHPASRSHLPANLTVLFHSVYCSFQKWSLLTVLLVFPNSSRRFGVNDLNPEIVTISGISLTSAKCSNRAPAPDLRRSRRFCYRCSHSCDAQPSLGQLDRSGATVLMARSEGEVCSQCYLCFRILCQLCGENNAKLSEKQ